MIIYTIGHSIRSENEFMDILRYYKIKYVIDVRRWPTSSRNPHFNREPLEKSLVKEDIKYLWFGESMGGYRKLNENERIIHRPGKCLKSGGFQAYAAHMETKEFKNALDELLKIAKRYQTAIMCAEKFYWKCHRLLISDKLKSIGVDVIHIINKDYVVQHNYSSCAKIKNGELIYI